MPLDFAKTVLQCGSELPIHKVLKQTLQDKGPSGLFTGMVNTSQPCTLQFSHMKVKWAEGLTLSPSDLQWQGSVRAADWSCSCHAG